MPDKKLTDNDIKKAVECCLAYDFLYCDKCPCQDNCAKINVGKLALDYINRLEAENETLRTCVANNFVIRKDGKSSLSLLKAEAYKECFEKIKAYYKETRFAYDAENLCEELDGLSKTW
jgi:hypothetical protein